MFASCAHLGVNRRHGAILPSYRRKQEHSRKSEQSAEVKYAEGIKRTNFHGNRKFEGRQVEITNYGTRLIVGFSSLAHPLRSPSEFFFGVSSSHLCVGNTLLELC